MGKKEQNIRSGPTHSTINKALKIIHVARLSSWVVGGLSGSNVSEVLVSFLVAERQFQKEPERVT